MPGTTPRTAAGARLYSGAMPVHSRQYLIGPEAREVRPDWRTRQVADGIVLSHAPELPVEATPHGLVLGDRLPTTEPDAGPDTWSGRWILLDGGTLRMDTGGLLACFMRTTPAGHWASSSLELLRTLEPELVRSDDRLTRDWRRMDWYPPPHSAIDGIERLLPSQRLDLASGRRRRTALPGPAADAELDVLVGRVADRLTMAIRAAADLAAAGGGRLWIGLTGGHDSRVVLASAVAAGLDVMTYTFIRPQTVQGDRDLPPRLADAAGYEHVTIPLEVVDPGRAAEFDEHTAGGFTGGPQLQYSTGGWERVEASAVALEGGCFEVARGYYYDRLPREHGGPEAAADAILERFPSARPEGVRAWTRWALEADGEGSADPASEAPDRLLDWRDRFYLEQRVGGWLSAGLQGFDLSGRRQVHIANERGLLGDLLAVPQPLRRQGMHEAALVERLAPELASFPVNPDAGKGGDGRGRRSEGAGRAARRPGEAGAGGRAVGILARLRRR